MGDGLVTGTSAGPPPLENTTSGDGVTMYVDSLLPLTPLPALTS